MEVWKINFFSKWVICRFHVNLPQCTLPKKESHSLLTSVSLLGKPAVSLPGLGWCLLLFGDREGRSTINENRGKRRLYFVFFSRKSTAIVCLFVGN